MTYQNHVRKTGARGRDGSAPLSLEPHIGEVARIIARKSAKGTYKFTAYRQLLVSKGAHRVPRILSIPTARDRIVLKSLAFLIEEVFPESKGSLAQQKVASLQRALSSKKFDAFVRLDIENFYPSVSHATLMQVLGTRIMKQEILTLISGAITTPTLADNTRRSDVRSTRGVPQGLPISNLLAEVAMQEVDALFANRQDLIYLRYVDDIIVLCNANEAEPLSSQITAACKSINLKVHEPLPAGSKSRIGKISESFDYLGYLFGPEKISVRAESVNKVKASLARVFTRYKYETAGLHKGAEAELKARSECLWKLNLVIAGCVFDGQRHGWLHYFSQITDISLLKSLDATVLSLARRFGLPAEFAPKTFVRTYWISRGNLYRPSYILNFDVLSFDGQREILSEVFHLRDAAAYSDSATESTFRREIRRLVSQLEKDISGLS